MPDVSISGRNRRFIRRTGSPPMPPKSAFCKADGRFAQLRGHRAFKPSLHVPELSAYAYRRGRSVSSSRSGRRLANQLEEVGDLQYPHPGIGAEPQQVAISGNRSSASRWPRAHSSTRLSSGSASTISSRSPGWTRTVQAESSVTASLISSLDQANFARRIRLSSSSKASEIASRNRPAWASWINRLGGPAKINPEMYMLVSAVTSIT